MDLPPGPTTPVTRTSYPTVEQLHPHLTPAGQLEVEAAFARWAATQQAARADAAEAREAAASLRVAELEQQIENERESHLTQIDEIRERD